MVQSHEAKRPETNDTRGRNSTDLVFQASVMADMGLPNSKQFTTNVSLPHQHAMELGSMRHTSEGSIYEQIARMSKTNMVAGTFMSKLLRICTSMIYHLNTIKAATFMQSP
mmetsp:Transcript_22324/g.40202  ORF Transcript_22324/g.40202 Transcript_22324/m.40202 type:complete len:111 (-) Transcript_22324:248-580(-)